MYLSGEQLRKCRTLYNWSQPRLAMAVGCVTGVISSHELGYSRMRTSTMDRIVDVFGVESIVAAVGESGPVLEPERDIDACLERASLITKHLPTILEIVYGNNAYIGRVNTFVKLLDECKKREVAADEGI